MTPSSGTIPRATPIALVLDSPHSGECYPDDFDHAPPRAIVRQAEDTHVARLWRSARRPWRDADRGALSARVHRRQPQPRRHRRRAARRPVAAIRSRRRARRRRASASSGGSRAAACRCMRASSTSARGARAHRPLLAARITPRSTRCSTRATARSAPCGTSTATRCPRWATRLPTIPGRERADFVLGDRDGTTCEPAFTALVADVAARPGLHRRDQRSVQGRRDRAQARAAAERRHSLQIELKRTLYMDEDTLGAERGLREACDAISLDAIAARASRATSRQRIGRTT